MCLPPVPTYQAAPPCKLRPSTDQEGRPRVDSGGPNISHAARSAVRHCKGIGRTSCGRSHCIAVARPQRPGRRPQHQRRRHRSAIAGRGEGGGRGALADRLHSSRSVLEVWDG